MTEPSMAETNRRAYDEAASKYSQVVGSSVAHRLIVMPTISRLLGDVSGEAVLCLGCGDGMELELLAQRGARELVGVDISEGLLRQCAARNTGATLIHADLEKYEPEHGRFNVACASMSLQYVADLNRILRAVHAALRPPRRDWRRPWRKPQGGRLVFAVGHPVYYGATWEEFPGGERLRLGWEINRNSEGIPELTLLGDYLTERVETAKLQGQIEVTDWVRPVARVLQAIIDAGFDIHAVEEPAAPEPSDDDDPETRMRIQRRQAIPLILAGSAARR